MNITTEQIKDLRDATGVSVMQCKKALEESLGDIEKAKIILRKISKVSLDKKSDRELGAGVVVSYIHNNGTVGTILELLCETDFVAKNEAFLALAKDIAMHVTALAPSYTKLEDIPEEEKVKARELFEKEAGDKSGEMKIKIIEGKLNSYLKEKALLEQSFIKNPEVTIKNLIEEATQKFGERTEIGRFSRFSIK